MPSRLLRCGKCDGSGNDEAGHPCTDCRGAGVFRWGGERLAPELASELASVSRILAADEAEATTALALFHSALGPEKAGRHKQIQHLQDAVAYWRARKAFLEAELGIIPR